MGSVLGGRLAFPLGFGVAAAAGYLAAGVVSALALGAYGVVAVFFLRRRRTAAARRAARSALLDRLTGLAADLRAGLPANAALAAFAPPPDSPITRAWSAVTLGERADRPTNAPAAEFASDGLVRRVCSAARLAKRPGRPANAPAAEFASPRGQAWSTETLAERMGPADAASADVAALRDGLVGRAWSAARLAERTDHPANAALADVVRPHDPLARLARSAVTLAERTGAPLADLVDRIEADARAGDRARDAAAAQAAGAQATALLLAALPLGGLLLGYAIGSDPIAVLLHTPLGALCALGAVALQILGLAWSQRLQPRLS